MYENGNEKKIKKKEEKYQNYKGEMKNIYLSKQNKNNNCYGDH